MTMAVNNRGERKSLRQPWKKLKWPMGLLCAVGLMGLLRAGEAEPVQSVPAQDTGVGADAGGGELLQFQDFPTVVSVTRQASSSNVSSVPVTVITDKEIHRRGAMNVPQLFEFVPGMDVVKLDRNRTAIGIRGMFGSINDRILCLVDGAKTADPTSGSTNFMNYPLFLEDIQRVEVVRGPSGAAWGANAFYGVINVITKDPADTVGYMATSTVDQYGDTQTQLRYGGQNGDARWRISTGYENHVSSAAALNRDTPAVDGGFTASTDSRLVLEADPHVKITFGLSYLHQETDTPDVLSYRPNSDQKRNLARGFMRADMELSENLNTNWTAYYNYNDFRLPSSFSSMDRETGLESQFDYTGVTDHKIAFGGSLRASHSQGYRMAPLDWQFAHNPNEETWAGLFFVDRYQMNPHAWLELQARGDLFKFNVDGVREDWSGRAAFIYGLDDSLNHVFRISGAKSYRAPTPLLRDSVIRRFEYAPGSFALNVDPGENIGTETIWSLEAGYTGRVASNWTVQANAYYNRYFNLISANKYATFGPVEYYHLENIDGAYGYGGELEVEYHNKAVQIKAYYAYCYLHPDHRKALLRATPASPNKAGVTVDWTLTPDWSAFLGYRYNDQTPGDTGDAESARPFHQMDITTTYRVRAVHGEFMVGVIDLFNDTALGFVDIGTIGTPESTPGRTFEARAQFDF